MKLADLGLGMTVGTRRALRVLDFDIENRPLSYLGSDFTTSEITAIAAGWTDDPTSIESALLGVVPTVEPILRWFVKLWDQADIVTGHYILMHDLPIINGALLECNMPPLGPKLVSDTKVHLIGGKGVSKSQESLADMLGIDAPKEQMSQAKWRAANRLTFDGILETKRRVEGDVVQHMQLRAALIAGGYLKPPKLWKGPRS